MSNVKKFYVRFMSKIKFFLATFFTCFVLFLVPNVHAFSVAGRELQYPTTTMGYNYATDSTWVNLPLTFGTEYQAYYTTNAVTTGNYGIAFGGLTGTTFIPGHYYSLVYAASKPSSGCKIPYSWNQIVAASSLISGSTTNRMTRVNNNMSTGYVEWDLDAFDACIYTTMFQVSQPSQYLMLPVNSQSTEQNRWVFYGYNVEDLGLTSNLSVSDLNNMSTALQTSISNQTTTINNNINTQSTNIQNKIDAAKNQAHQDAQQAHTDATNIKNSVDSIKNQDHTYNNNAKDNVPNSTDVTNVTNAEDTLLNSLDLDSSTLDFTLSTDTSSWIWGVISNIRISNGKLTLLITSILSLAIIKMVLNR